MPALLLRMLVDDRVADDLADTIIELQRGNLVAPPQVHCVLEQFIGLIVLGLELPDRVKEQPSTLRARLHGVVGN